MKRERSLSCDRDLELWARRSRRRQLRIEIPRATLSHSSQCSSKASSIVKESPSSLFSASSVDSIFHDDIPPSPGLAIVAIPIIRCAPMTATSSAGSLNATAINCTNNPHESNELQKPHLGPALRSAPPIQGLYFYPSLRLPQELADKVVDFCMGTYFQSPSVNQVMLFGRANNLNSDNLTQYPDTNTSTGNSCTIPRGDCSATSTLASPVLSSLTETCNTSNTTGLPTILVTLLSTLSTLLKPLLPPKTYLLLFPSTTTQARQAIINLYAPGEGISPHVDLIKRYGDGIIGVSFSSGCVMRFDRDSPPLSETMEKPTNRWELYLPERSVYVLTEDARFGWTHGIEKTTRDYAVVDARQGKGIWIDRSVRLSVTYRWLLPGADIVGPSEDH
ncbi:hypothetical protein JOM56_009126 [Amanita muscaria]